MVKIEKVKTIECKLNAFDLLARDSEYITVTEWANGEGFDVDINDKRFGLTYGQLKAINILSNALEYNFNIDIKGGQG